VQKDLLNLQANDNSKGEGRETQVTATQEQRQSYGTQFMATTAQQPPYGTQFMATTVQQQSYEVSLAADINDYDDEY
ncbi:unnamed protein product, partial [Rotaria sp. Silwood2]